MGLLIGDKDVFEVKAIFEEKGNNSLVFYGDGEKIPETAKRETFTFRKPRWSDMRRMMSESIMPTGMGVVINPYVFMDIKLKQLLQDWTLQEKGKKVKVDAEHIDMLHPALCDYLNAEVDKILGTKDETPAVPPIEKLP
jgi:hypothetical protein